MEGTRLGPYLIDRELGSGGMGRVFAARTSREVAGLASGTTVALKVVHPHLLETPDALQRFLREAEIGQAVAHENVVRTLAHGEAQEGGSSVAYLVMEYVEGQTLADLQRELERVPEELCRHIGREVCQGLRAIHEVGAVHRDLKPENVLITPEHVVKVMDLGIAKLVDAQVKLSRTGLFVGSLEYAAPEQFRGAGTDPRTDLHALGLLLYELATGQNPYRGGDVHEVVGRVLNDEVRRLGEVEPQLSPFFEEVVHTLLAKRVEDRFDDAASVLSVLELGEDSAWWHARARCLEVATRRPLRRIRIARETAVYGRDLELAKLREAYDAARSGEGRVVLVSGEAGIGKSRLVDELVARLQADGEDVNFLFGGYPPGGAATVAGGFAAAFRDQFGEAGSAPWLEQAPLLVPAFDAVLSGETSETGAVQLSLDSLGTCFVHATRSLARERTTIVLIDDLHFAPTEARRLFMALAHAAPGHRVLLIGTMRPGISEEWMAGVARLEHSRRVELARLGPKDLVQLLRESFSSDALADQLGAQIALKSDGNPFFAFEIVRGLREGQFIQQTEDGSWVSTGVIRDVRIPSSLLDLVHARIADLDEADKDLLEVASCWGHEFDPWLIAAAAGVPLLPALKRLARIERTHRLVRASGRSMVFDHHQVQEALYSGLLVQLREHYHAELADALAERHRVARTEPEALEGGLAVELCTHYLRGNRGAAAVTFLGAAQAHLARTHAHEQSEELAERALAVPGLLDGAPRARVLLALADTLELLGRRDRQETAAREALELAEQAADDSLRASAALATGMVCWRTARPAEAEAAFRLALQLSRACGDRTGESRAEGRLGALAASMDRVDDARRHLDRQLAISRELGDWAGVAGATGNQGLVLSNAGHFAEAIERFEETLAAAQAAGDLRIQSAAHGNLGMALRPLGRIDEARVHLARQTELCRRVGYRQGESIALGNLGLCALSERRLSEARELMERQLVLVREIAYTFGEAITLANLGGVFIQLGELDRAPAVLERSLQLSRETGAPYVEGYALFELGRLALERGELEGALRRMEESLVLRRRIGHGDGVVQSLIELGDMRRVVGDTAVACDLLQEALQLSREQGMSAATVLASSLVATLRDTDASAASIASDQVENERERFALWRATGDREHLDQAKRLLDEALTLVPEECHESMLTNVRVNREIMEAWRAEFVEDGGTESVTRVGDA